MLENKVILITGASRGIGRACAEACAANGAVVLLNARDEKKGRTAADHIVEAHPAARVYPLIFDVRDPAAVRDAFGRIQKDHGRLDTLVNNAGILRDALIGMVSRAVLDEVIGVNFVGAFYCAQLAARFMAKQRSGSIINISSIVGREGNAGQSVYSASKAALLGMTYSLAKELGPANIRVNAVAPGFIRTEMIGAVPKEQFQAIESGIRMQRLGEPEEVAGCVVFLASDLSSYVTGQVIGVDGGMTI